MTREMGTCGSASFPAAFIGTCRDGPGVPTAIGTGTSAVHANVAAEVVSTEHRYAADGSLVSFAVVIYVQGGLALWL